MVELDETIATLDKSHETLCVYIYVYTYIFITDETYIFGHVARRLAYRTN